MRIVVFLLPLMAAFGQGATDPRVDKIFAEWAKPDSPGCMPRANLTAIALKEFAGTYRLEEMESEWTIAAQDRKLTVTRLRVAAGSVEPQIANVFVMRSSGGGGIVQFTRGKDGKIDGFLLNGGRIRNVRFRRLK